MMKLAIFAVLGLCVGIGGGSAFTVMKAKKAHAAGVALHATQVADSLASAEQGAKAGPDSASSAPDSTELPAGDGVEAEADTLTPRAAGKAPGKKPAARTAPAGAGAPGAAPVSAAVRPSTDRAIATVGTGVPATGNAAAKPPAAAAPPAGPPSVALTKLAKIFAAMPPKEAAKVLEQLDNSEVQAVLSGLNGKEAAAILQHLPPERAGAISKAALRAALVSK